MWPQEKSISLCIAFVFLGNQRDIRDAFYEMFSLFIGFRECEYPDIADHFVSFNAGDWFTVLDSFMK